jgi:uncharacterized protein
MKYLLLLAIVLAVIWFLRNHRRGDEPRQDPPRQDKLGEPQDMVRCQVCSVHLPRTDALPGPGERYYCCADHRSRAGD